MLLGSNYKVWHQRVQQQGHVPMNTCHEEGQSQSLNGQWGARRIQMMWFLHHLVTGEAQEYRAMGRSTYRAGLVCQGHCWGEMNQGMRAMGCSTYRAGVMCQRHSWRGEAEQNQERHKQCGGPAQTHTHCSSQEQWTKYYWSRLFLSKIQGHTNILDGIKWGRHEPDASA